MCHYMRVLGHGTFMKLNRSEVTASKLFVKFMDWLY